MTSASLPGVAQVELCTEVPCFCEVGEGVIQTTAAPIMSQSLVHRSSALPFILTAVAGFIVGYLTSKVLDWINPEPGSGKVPARHIHDHHHFHHQSPPRHDPTYNKIIG